MPVNSVPKYEAAKKIVNCIYVLLYDINTIIFVFYHII